MDEEESNRWLKSAGLKSETEGLIVAAQDQALKTKYMQAKIIKMAQIPTAEYVDDSKKQLDHITSGCPELAKTEYVHRHNKVATYVHWNICRNFDINVPDKWYEHQPEPVTEHQKAIILWDLPVHTDREIKACKQTWYHSEMQRPKKLPTYWYSDSNRQKHLYQSNRKTIKVQRTKLKLTGCG